MNNEIDFVILWVDGSDPKWLKEKAKYDTNINTDSNDNRYRDPGFLKYWFRGIEEYAPWVRKIHFVTCGHLPKWLNTQHPQLHIVKHTDFIPKDILPTFNSNSIEIYINNIPDLLEHFVCFNDDMFLTKPVLPEYFFKKNLPTDTFNYDAVTADGSDGKISHIILNDLEIVGNYFSKKQATKNNLSKLLIPPNKNILRTLFTTPWKGYTGVYNHHCPISFLKSTMDLLWEQNRDALAEVSTNKFRSKTDYSIWLFRYYQLFSGQYYRRKPSSQKYFRLKEDANQAAKAIRTQKYTTICINDAAMTNIDASIAEITAAFKDALPHKSRFEK